MAISITRNPNLAKARQSDNCKHELNEQFQNTWWTGLAPQNCPGFDSNRQCLVALPQLELNNCTKQNILDYFNNSWTLTELLFQGLKVEEVYIRPPYHALRHPMMFYYGHPAVVYINKLRLAGLLTTPLNLYLEKILETGVDEMSWDDMGKNEMEWPSIKAVHAYRKAVYNLIIQLISTKKEEKNLLQDSPWWALWMGMEHEKIHFETSSVLIRELPLEFVEAPKYWAPMHPSHTQNDKNKNEWLQKSGETVTIGKPNSIATYGWDNEYGERKQTIKDFQYTKYQITNREYFDFVASASYIDDVYWSNEGKHWRKFRNTKRPTFWVGVGPEGSHEYELRTIFNIIPMPWNWPVEVNFHEAEAFCHWKNSQDKSQLCYRLLTEAEFNVLDMTQNNKQQTPNSNFMWSTPKNVSDELYGNSWHWLLDQFNPLPNFKVHPYYDDFSTPCFDGKHQMMKGGSFISCGDEASKWARFHFRPHFYQHSGFRMAATLDGSHDNGGIKLLQTDSYIHPRRENILDQMQASADWWKKVEQPLEMNEEEMTALFNQTQTEIFAYSKKFESMSPMGQAHDPNTQTLKKDFTLPYQMSKNFPEIPADYHSLIKMIFNEMAPLSQLPGHPGFVAYVAGSGNAISNTAQLIAQTLNPFTGHYMMAPGLVSLEQEVIKWFINLMGYGDRAIGYLTTGGSSATMNALMIARLNKIADFDYSKVTGYASSEAHHCIAKAWVMLGFKKENLRLIKAKNFKIDTTTLQQSIDNDKLLGMKPFFLLATLGSTKTGSLDDLKSLADIAAKENLWLHGDGAYGALFMLTEKGKKLLQGIERCDSLALDPHKALSIPYGTGCLLIKDAKNISFDYAWEDSYMPPSPTIGNHDYADITPELSRDYRGLRVWLPIKTLGIAPFKLNLEEKLQLSTWLCEELKAIPNIKILAEPELSIFAFAHQQGNAATKELMQKINNKGTLFLSGCTLNGQEAIRICLLGYRVHYDRLKKAVAEIREMLA